MSILVFDQEALYVALDRERRTRRIRWHTVAAEAGLSKSTLTRLGQGHAVNADGLVRLLTWLGNTDLKPYIHEVSEAGGEEEEAGDG